MSIFLQNTIFINWVYTVSASVSWNGVYNRGVLHNNVYFDNIYITDTLVTVTNYLINSSNSFFWFQNSLDTQFFALELTPSILKQTIYNHTYLYTFHVNIYDIPSLVTDNALSIISLFIITRFYKKLKIMF